MKNKLVAAVLGIGFLLTPLLADHDQERSKVSIYSGEEKLADLSLEVADNDSERRQGLMNRETLESDGMIFVYDREQELSFWMKNTLIPLDMIFVYENGTINQIHKAYPEPNTPESKLNRYTARGKYVIEVEQNFTDRKGISKGDRAEITLP